MQPCEQCDGTEALLKKRQYDFLEKYGIRPEGFVAASPWQRLGLLRDHLQLDVYAHKEAQAVDKNLGLIVIKPEMIDQSAVIEECLAKKLGLEILSSEPFVYTPEAYWSIYGEGFLNYFRLFPHGALLFLLSTNLTSRAVVFRHLTPARYCELKRSMVTPKDHDIIPEVVDGSEDPQDFFDKLFVRNNHASIRSTLCRPNLDDRGFAAMINDSCPGQCWDFTGTFSRRTSEQNRRTFNGIHCPGNQKDLAVAFAVIPVKI